MIRVLLVEADPANSGRLSAYLSAETDVQIVGQCSQGDDAQDRINVLRPDAVFLSAEIPDFRTAQALQMAGAGPYVVVMSASDQYAVDAFAMSAVDYLLVPVDPKRLVVTLGRLRRLVEADMQLEGRLDMDMLVRYVRDQSARMAASREDNRVPINFGGRYRFLNLDAIRYVTADADYVDIHMITGEILHSTNRISEMAHKLPQDRFLRVRRSTIVNIERIREARAHKDNYEIVMDNGVVFRPGSTYKFKVRKTLVIGAGPRNGGAYMPEPAHWAAKA